MLLPDKGLVGGLIHQRIEFFRIAESYLDEPALAHRVGVDLGRIGDDPVIDRDDFAGDRRIDLVRRLGGFDDRRLLALLDMPAERWRSRSA